MSWWDQYIRDNWNDERFERPVLLRTGSYSWVYECIDNGNPGKLAVVKCIPLVGGGPGLQNRIEREIDTLHLLNHPNVVRLILLRREEDFVKLALEFMHADLREYVDEVGPLDPNEIKSFMFQILQGLSHIHSHGIVHCNVNPVNLLLDEDTKMIKITGFSRRIKLEDPPSACPITSHMYNPPEILLRRPEITTAADIWMAGCIFADMVKGYCLLTASNLWTPELDLAVFFPELEPNALDLLKKMLRPVPSERISADDALRHPYFDDVQHNH